MNNIFFALCLFALALPLQSQDILLSQPKKLTNKVTEYEIIGRTQQGVMVHKWGDRYNLIEAYYNETLGLAWEKELILNDKKAIVQTIIPYANKMLIIYTVKEKRTTNLYARKVSDVLKDLSGDILLDSFEKGFGAYNPKYEVKYSKKRNFISIVRYDYDFNGISNINILVLNKEGQALSQKDIPFNEKWTMKEVFVNNKGLVFLASAKIKRNILNLSPQHEEVRLQEYNYETDIVSEYLIEKGEHSLNDIKIVSDDKNNRIAIAGFYSEKQSNAISGYFGVFFDLKTHQIEQQFYENFEVEIARKTNLTAATKKDYVYNLKMRNVILRQDGGALFIGETYYTSNRSIPRSSFDTFNTRQQVSLNYHYNDLVVLSVNPNGSLLWDEVLKKRQYSEEDKGYYSSFGMANSGQFLNLIFNEEISNNTNINNYKIESTGDYTIESMMNANDYNIMLAPRYYKQTSPSEIVMPAFNRKNEFLLVKVGF
ncbi:MAG: hypothetical protein ACPG5B_14465 [Chitinophagales bacterium]